MGAQAVRLSNIDIDNALEKRHFELLFQPIFDLSNGALARVETFVRWRHETLGLLPPGAFISFFETQGRMSELTRYVLEETLESYLGWRGAVHPGFSINLALSDLTDESFVSHFTVFLREKNFPAELVTLECPMPPVTMDRKTAIASFDRLAQTGARLAIEVRGRANDFVRSLDPFPFAEIKTGGAAILRFARTVRGPGLSAISELLELAAKRNAAITAVGVEDQASLSALRDLNFDAAQGNHLGRVGALKDFKLSKVNEIRNLLELQPLSKTDLESLFRTESPEVSQREKSTLSSQSPRSTTKPKPKAKPVPDESKEISEQELVDRLQARLASDTDGKPNVTEQRKAAAIKRARQKLKNSKKEIVETIQDQDGLADIATELASTTLNTPPAQETIEPHDLQKRLSKEFNSDSEKPALDELETSPSKESAKQDKTVSKNQTIADVPADNDIVTKAPLKNQPQIAIDAPETEIAIEQQPKQEEFTELNVITSPKNNSGSIPEEDIQEEIPSIANDGLHIQNKDESKKVLSFNRLSIPHARAFFKFGIRVAGPEAVSLDEIYNDFEISTAAQNNKRENPMQSENKASNDKKLLPVDNQLEQQTNPAILKPDPLTSTATKNNQPAPELISNIPVQVDTPEEHQEDTATETVEYDETQYISAVKQVDEIKTTAREKQNFLKRKHQLYSGYFWPRAWRKSWAAKKAEQLAADSASLDD